MITEQVADDRDQDPEPCNEQEDPENSEQRVPEFEICDQQDRSLLGRRSTARMVSVGLRPGVLVPILPPMSEANVAAARRLYEARPRRRRGDSG